MLKSAVLVVGQGDFEEWLNQMIEILTAKYGGAKYLGHSYEQVSGGQEFHRWRAVFEVPCVRGSRC